MPVIMAILISQSPRLNLDNLCFIQPSGRARRGAVSGCHLRLLTVLTDMVTVWTAEVIIITLFI